MTLNREFDTDVLIVGSGPTGSTTALALATYGIRAHIVSLWNWLAHTPRAHITNQRTVEVFRDLGIEEEVLERATPWDDMGDTPYATSLAGEELVRQRCWGTGDRRRGEYIKASPCGLVDIIQPKIEPILLTNAAKRGVTSSFNTEYLRHEQDDAGVTVYLRERLTGREYTMRARYLVGADGARSLVAEEIELPIEGEMARAGTVYATFEADLSKHVAHRPSILNWIVSPDTSFGEIGLGLLRAVNPWTRWIAGWGFDISKGEPDLTDDHVLGRIKTLIGDNLIEPKLLNTSVWYVNQAYATSYSKGRVFCGGDAVHRHPPSSGLGLNTCVQDGFNLAWKLAYVVHGFADRALLESYSAERAPVGKQIVQRANQSRLDYADVNACFRVAGANNPVEAGIRLLKDSGAEGQARRAKLLTAIRHKDTEFNALGVELNQRYESSAVVPEPGAGPEKFEQDKELYLKATTRPGAKLPHAWLVGADGRRISTLDVVGKGMITVLTGIAGRWWVQAANELGHPFLRVVTVGSREYLDLYCDWREIMEIDEGGMLLVRPDCYIAFRASKVPETLEAARTVLASALELILGKSATIGALADMTKGYEPNFEPHLFD
ncbi:FAD-dependent oxidoreductase [Sphingobium xenophagum]